MNKKAIKIANKRKNSQKSSIKSSKSPKGMSIKGTKSPRVSPKNFQKINGILKISLWKF